MSRVIFLSRTDKDVSSAEDFGELVFLLNRVPNPFQITELIEEVVHRLDEIQFEPATDFIAMTGPPERLAVMFGVIANLFNVPLKMLIYDAQVSAYKSRVFDASVYEKWGY